MTLDIDVRRIEGETIVNGRPFCDFVHRIVGTTEDSDFSTEHGSTTAGNLERFIFKVKANVFWGGCLTRRQSYVWTE